MSYLDIQQRRAELIRKALQGSVFIANASAAAITVANLFDMTTGDLKALPAGYTDLGILTDAGVKASRAVKQTDLMGWGFNAPVRSDVTSDTTTLVLEPQETKLETLATYIGVDPSTITPDPTSGVFSVDQVSVDAQRRYRVLVVAVDEAADGTDIVIARFLPAAGITAINDQVLANAADAITWGVTFTGYFDTTVGTDVRWLFGGAGGLEIIGDMDVPRTLVCSTSAVTSGSPPADTVLTATTGTFTAYDVGRVVTGGTIPAGAKIITFTDATHVVISLPTTATATGVPVTVS